LDRVPNATKSIRFVYFTFSELDWTYLFASRPHRQRSESPQVG